jgi:Uma2 family endonuclease
MAVAASRRLFTVREFHQMAQAAIFGEDDRVELLAGEIVQMTPIGSRHAACVSRLNRLLSRLLGDESIVRVQDPLHLDDHSEPQPDLVVVHRREDFYRDAHPRPRDVQLVIEVSDTSAADDRTDKVPLYARSGIPEVWLVDLTTASVDVYREPAADGYRHSVRVERPATLTASTLSIPGIRVDDIVG